MSRLAPRIAALREQLERWMLRSPRPEALPLVLGQRRIYVLPTGVGLSFGGLLLTMLIASVNYNLALGFALSFLLAGVANLSLLRAHRNLLGLKLLNASAAAAFAGEAVRLQLQCTDEAGRARYRLEIGDRCGADTLFDLAPRTPLSIEVLLGPRPRGRHPLGRLRMATRHPLGLIRAWAYLEPALTLTIYPRPEPNPPPRITRMEGGRDGASRRTGGGSSFDSLRHYRAGDSPRQIAWRRVARGGPLISKVFVDESGSEQCLSWQDTTNAGDTEARLSRLCAWVLQMETAQQAWRLELPGIKLGAGRGAEHKRQALEALADFGGPGV